MRPHQFIWRRAGTWILHILLANIEARAACKRRTNHEGWRKISSQRSGAKSDASKRISATKDHVERAKWGDETGGTKRSNWRGDDDWDGVIRGDAGERGDAGRETWRDDARLCQCHWCTGSAGTMRNRGRDSAGIREREPANWPTKAGHGQERQGQPVCSMHVRGGNAQRPAIKRARRETMFDTTGTPVRLAQCSQQPRVVGRGRGVSEAVPEGGARSRLRRSDAHRALAAGAGVEPEALREIWTSFIQKVWEVNTRNSKLLMNSTHHAKFFFFSYE